jgi:hypothetical protein
VIQWLEILLIAIAITYPGKLLMKGNYFSYDQQRRSSERNSFKFLEAVIYVRNIHILSTGSSLLHYGNEFIRADAMQLQVIYYFIYVL